MASSDNAQAISLLAGEDMAIFRVVFLSGEREASLATDATDKPVGVSGEEVLSGDVLAVNSNSGSIVMVELGGTVLAGASLKAEATGTVISTAAVAGEFTVGEAVEGGDAGDVISMILNIQSIDA